MRVTMNEIADVLRKNEEFLIMTHMKPDGDAVASSVGLAMVLKSMGKKTAVKCCDEFPQKFDFLTKDYVADTLVNPIVVGVDIPSVERLGSLQDSNVTVCIDHHASNSCLVEKTYVEEDAVSCSLILYKLFRFMQVEIPKNALALLFAGIVTDSVCFQSAATNAEAFAVAGEMANVIDLHSIIHRVFVSKTKEELDVEQAFLASFTYYHDGQMVVGILRNDKISLIGKKNVSGYAVKVLKPANTRVGIAILEKDPNKFNVSFKSSEFDMVALAKQFGGGGHTESAGALVETEDLDGLVKNIVEKVGELLCTE